MARKPDWYYRQSAAVPWRRRSHGGLEVLLVTTRKKKRWILPKGIVEPNLTPAASAAAEAWEEAGVRGIPDERPLGSYLHGKWGGTCTVEVFPFRVDAVMEHWPEQSFRERRWADLHDLPELLHPPQAAAVAAVLGKRVNGR